ncbi:unnamed protein product [Rotaria sordida]|uniref:Uncharacterized protein n=1 Tax=Rotaria sordida TaxID=392033 RepID=A0A815LH93_9BILA|nr:unnamed protein product [Rotaria sordida]CAF1403267.1 unnamed protein product [Rotaria sordida]
MSFDLVRYDLAPAGYTPGMKFSGSFVKPAHFSFPPSSMWSSRYAKYTENIVGGRIGSVTVQLIEDGIPVHSLKITEQQYHSMPVYSSAPKLLWGEFVQVLKVFMLGNQQERESDIVNAFDLLDQQTRGLYGRPVSLPDGLISPDELRAFLSILCDEVFV